MRISDWSSDVCSSDLLLEIAIVWLVAPYLEPLLTGLNPDRSPKFFRARDVNPIPIAVLCDRHQILDDFLALRRRDQTSALIAKRGRSEEHTSELQSLMRSSYAVFCLKKKKQINTSTSSKMITTNQTQIQTHEHQYHMHTTT